MTIFKFWKKNNKVVLDNLIIEDITEDKRSVFIPKSSFLNDIYKIDNLVYMCVNDMFFKLGKMFSKKKYDCILFTYDGKSVYVLPSTSYVFWEGKSVTPKPYVISKNNSISSISKLLL